MQGFSASSFAATAFSVASFALDAALPISGGAWMPGIKPARKTKRLAGVMSATEAPDGAVLYGYTVERYAKARIDDEFLLMVA